MYIYIIMLIVSLLFCYLSEKIKNKKAKICFQVLSIIPFLVISAIRYNVGTDYSSRYAGEFVKIRRGYIPPNLEIGYIGLVKLCLLFSKSSILLFVLTSAIISFSIFSMIFKYSKNKLLSIFIFFAGCFFFQSLNIVRQYIAVCMILIFYQLLIDKKYKSMIIPIILAISMHTTSIISIISILLTKRIIVKPKIVFIMMLIIILFSGIFNDVVGVLISNTRFSVYMGSVFDRSEIKYTALVVNITLYIISYYLMKKKKEITRTDIIYINLLGMAVLVSTLGRVHYLFNRITYYFSIIQILAVPQFISSAPKTSMLKLKNKNIQIQSQMLLVAFVVVLLTVNITYTNIINNDDGVLPYKTIFNKEE